MPPIKIDSGLYSLYNMPNPNGGLVAERKGSHTMKKSAVLYIALGRYVSFWKGFYVCGAFNGGVRWLRGQSERKIPNNWFIRNVMIPGCKVVSVFIPSKKYRNKVKNHFGSI